MESVTKLRILYLYQYLLQHTDAAHPMSTVELSNMLEKEYGITTARNTISNDLTMLANSGLNIRVIRRTQNVYYYDGAAFELPELKILIDAVSATKFIAERKSEELINKLMSMTSLDNAQKLRRNIEVEGRVKTDNQCGYDIVDIINEGIDTRRKIAFCYTDFDVDKKRYLTNDGRKYTVSPYTLIWDGDYYYLRGYCDEREAMRTFRLDRIDRTPEILMEAAVPKPDDYDVAQYRKSVFRMYDTDQPVEVELFCHVSTMKVLIDNFGLDVDTRPVDADHFIARVKVCTSPTFYRWVFGFGCNIEILQPQGIRDEFERMLRIACDQYASKE
ncbi:MAG: WYL domain-containing protein [Blautia sp.]|nr:WYL domain-containing protein [Blautia sp.]